MEDGLMSSAFLSFSDYLRYLGNRSSCNDGNGMSTANEFFDRSTATKTHPPTITGRSLKASVWCLGGLTRTNDKPRL